MSLHREVLAAVLVATMAVSVAFAQDWTPFSVPPGNWGCLASSADGRKLVGADYWNDQVFVSTNFGSTWTLTNLAANNSWSAVACSADGSVIIVGGYAQDQGLYVSQDSGVTWRLAFSLGVYYWNSLACSSDGTRMVAVSNSWYDNTNSVYISTNSGADWVHLTGSPGAGPVTMSADGSRLAIATGATVDVSTNFGLTWTSRYPTSEPAHHRFVTTSGEGGTLIVLSWPTNRSLPAVISISSDWGATWRPVGSTTNTSWYTVSGACSADGVTLAIADSPDQGDYMTRLLLSTNSGASWSTQLIAGTNICSMVSSVDGSRLAAALGHSFTPPTPPNFYIRQTTPVPRLQVFPLPGNLELSWLLPSEPFVLEESPDLLTWSQVDATPILNYTNLHYVVNLPAPIVPKFYRLASQSVSAHRNNA